MRKLLLLAMFAAFAMPEAAQADIVIAGIDTWDSTSAPTVGVVAAGLTATATASTSSGAWSISDSGGDPGRGSSVDTTWGTFDGNGTAASSVTDVGTSNFTVTNARPTAEVTLTLTNNGPDDYDLNAFHFDAIAFRFRAPTGYTLSVLSGSDIDVGEVVSTPTGTIGALGSGTALADSNHDGHQDIDIDLTGLADNT